jgi:hypothetical protein
MPLTSLTLILNAREWENEIISAGHNWSDHKVWTSQPQWPLFIYVHGELGFAAYFQFLFHVYCHLIRVPLCVCYPIPILMILMFKTVSQVPINHKHWNTTVVEVTDTQRKVGKEHANKIPEDNSKVWTYTKFSNMTKRGYKDFEDGWYSHSAAYYAKGAEQCTMAIS